MAFGDVVQQAISTWAPQSDSTTDVVLDDTPTEGNLLLLMMGTQTTGGLSYMPAVAGFTVLATGAYNDSGDGSVSYTQLQVLSRTVQPGDGTTWTIDAPPLDNYVDFGFGCGLMEIEIDAGYGGFVDVGMIQVEDWGDAPATSHPLTPAPTVTPTQYPALIVGAACVFSAFDSAGAIQNSPSMGGSYVGNIPDNGWVGVDLVFASDLFGALGYDSSADLIFGGNGAVGNFFMVAVNNENLQAMAAAIAVSEVLLAIPTTPWNPTVKKNWVQRR